MQPFTVHTGLAAAMLQDNINTDLIIPKQFLKTIHRRGLGRHLFHDLRYREDGSDVPEFPLNREPGRHASILLAGVNFGCGSSREHAPWALLDFGIRAVLAPSFADIFATNAVKNGILPGVVAPEALQALAAYPGELVVDLQAERVRAGADAFALRTDPWARGILLEGLDEVEQTLRGIDRVEAFEQRRQAESPWL
ncbi:MAG: 3-isopropylmalate dehydratase small subunit [Holophaga sp.]|nr:3-isopropylmalate dehydratase small subunit [Holophaga sp.]